MTFLQKASSCSLIVVLLCCTGNRAAGECWSGPEGMISVEIPNGDRFSKTAEGVLTTWVSDDGFAVLAVETMPWPYSREIIEAPLHKGFLRELGGTMVDAHRLKVDGRTVFCMTARFKEDPAFGSYVCQHVFRVKDKVFKLMALRRMEDPREDQDITEFLSSLKINVSIEDDPMRAAKVTWPANADSASEPNSNVERTVEKIAGISFLVLVLFAMGAAFNRFRG